jgi:hypothetical protein
MKTSFKNNEILPKNKTILSHTKCEISQKNVPTIYFFNVICQMHRKNFVKKDLRFCLG